MLKSIEINKFKSFNNKETIKFSNKMICIIGNNGCGKSSLLEAILIGLGDYNFIKNNYQKYISKICEDNENNKVH